MFEIDRNTLKHWFLMFLKISKCMGQAENTLEQNENFVYNTLCAQYFSIIFYILNNDFLSTMIIYTVIHYNCIY